MGINWKKARVLSRERHTGDEHGPGGSVHFAAIVEIPCDEGADVIGGLRELLACRADCATALEDAKRLLAERDEARQMVREALQAQADLGLAEAKAAIPDTEPPPPPKRPPNRGRRRKA